MNPSEGTSKYQKLRNSTTFLRSQMAQTSSYFMGTRFRIIQRCSRYSAKIRGCTPWTL